MPYKYETHMHTLPASACARDTGGVMARAYRDAGYDGIIVTDHFFNGNNAIPADLVWEDRVDMFLSGYEAAKAEGDRIGLSVFLGWEYNYKGTEFLTYGLGREFLLKNPDILSLSPEEYFDLVHACGGLLVQAHPFREAPYISSLRLYPEHTDAIEIMNGRNTSEFNARAVEYVKDHDFPVTGGSDCHYAEEPKRGGMIFDSPLRDIFDYMDRVKARTGKVIEIE